MKAPVNFRFTGFCDLIADSVYQHKLATQSENSYFMNRHARASILSSALSVECVANCLLESLGSSSRLIKDLDRLPVLSKIEIYLLENQISGFSRGDEPVQKVADLINARNTYAHTRTINIPSEIGPFEDAGKDLSLIHI